ncbi:MAG: AzlD domain-containing protein [Solobacterium sp.]|nr:AzlD domain-containing protein [Solobacterium sp.]
MRSIWMQIFVMFAVTYLIRVLPLTLIRKPITNVYIRSFLYYVPYATLAVMTFPAMIRATNSLYSGILAFAAGVILTWKKAGLFATSVSCCIVVFIAELIIL